jgi:hypothetical protein
MPRRRSWTAYSSHYPIQYVAQSCYGSARRYCWYRNKLSAKLRALPCERVDKPYLFEGPYSANSCRLVCRSLAALRLSSHARARLGERAARVALSGRQLERHRRPPGTSRRLRHRQPRSARRATQLRSKPRLPIPNGQSPAQQLRRRRGSCRQHRFRGRRRFLRPLASVQPVARRCRRLRIHLSMTTRPR